MMKAISIVVSRSTSTLSFLLQIVCQTYQNVPHPLTDWTMDCVSQESLSWSIVSFRHRGQLCRHLHSELSPLQWVHRSNFLPLPPSKRRIRNYNHWQSNYTTFHRFLLCYPCSFFFITSSTLIFSLQFQKTSRQSLFQQSFYGTPYMQFPYCLLP